MSFAFGQFEGVYSVRNFDLTAKYENLMFGAPMSTLGSSEVLLTYPLKIASKIFQFSTMEFFGIFCFHLPSVPIKWPQNQILNILRPRAQYRAIRDTQKWLPGMLNWAVFDQN